VSLRETMSNVAEYVISVVKKMMTFIICAENVSKKGIMRINQPVALKAVLAAMMVICLIAVSVMTVSN
jgi:hypothetical protein